MNQPVHRRPARGRARLLPGILGGIALVLASTGGTQDAVANGDTRTLSFVHTHTGESATVTFRRDGRYDDAGLKQLNWLLRDWRVEKPAQMDPKLFDILWEVYREAGSSQPIHVISAYRSPDTNAMLRRRSKAVSEHSQHMLGKAMDIRLPDVSTERLREVAMKLQYGGVGYYSSSAFVHVDTGSVRAWPRMSEPQLARLFPDGKTVHVPANGKPLARYEEARLEVDAKKASLGSGSGPSFGSLFAGLFRRNDSAPAQEAGKAPAEPAPAKRIALASADGAVTANVITPNVITPNVLGFAPLPPRRPVELAAQAPVRPALPDPIRTASIGDVVVPMALVPAAAPPDEPADPASRLLFSSTPLDATPRLQEGSGGATPPAAAGLAGAEAAPLDLRFTSRPAGDLGLMRFSGPAVKPLPVLRQAKLEL